MYMPVQTPRHFEPYKKSEYSGDSGDYLKVVVAGGMWHLGNRYASIGDTTLNFTTYADRAIYVEYNKSIYGDFLTVSHDTPANVLALLASSEGFRFHYLGAVTSDSTQINLITDAWEGGDIISAYTDSVEVDNHSIEIDSLNYSPDSKLAMYGFNTGNPYGSSIPDEAMFPFAQGSTYTDLLWCDIDTLAQKIYDSGAEGPVHTWYLNANYHWDGPPVPDEYDDGAFLQWTESYGLIWNKLSSANWYHAQLYDIANNIGTDDHNGSPTAGNWPYVSGKSQGTGRNYFAVDVGLQDAAGNITLKPNERHLMYGDWTHKGTSTHFIIEGTDQATAPNEGCLRMAGGFSFQKMSWGQTAGGMVAGFLTASAAGAFYNPVGPGLYLCTDTYAIDSTHNVNVRAGYCYYSDGHMGYNSGEQLRILKSGGGYIEAYIRGGILCVD